MPDHNSNRLGAYLDGELGRLGQIEVQKHLEVCSACQAELEELRQLSTLLRAAPQPDFVPAQDFNARLMLQLPRGQVQAEAQSSRTLRSLLPWLAPVMVLGGWIFIQVTLNLSSLVTLAGQTGFLGQAAAWSSSDPSQTLWITAAQMMMNGMMSSQSLVSLNLLNNADLFVQNILISLLLQVGAALLYWGTLTIVWRTKVRVLWASINAG